jgi:hypothetical protein
VASESASLRLLIDAANEVSQIAGWNLVDDAPPLECSSAAGARAVLFVQKPHFLRGLITLGTNPYQDLPVAIVAGNGMMSPERWAFVSSYAKSRKLPVFTLVDVDLVGVLLRGSIRAQMRAGAPLVLELGLDETWACLLPAGAAIGCARPTRDERACLESLMGNEEVAPLLAGPTVEMLLSGESLMLDDFLRHATSANAQRLIERVRSDIERCLAATPKRRA